MTFNTARAATAAGLTEHQVRGYVSAGLVAPLRGPRGAFRYSFQDVVVLRTGKSLNEVGIPTRRIRRAMATLVSAVPPVSLSSVKIRAQGPRLVIDDVQGRWEPNSGQLQLPLDVEPGVAWPKQDGRPALSVDRSGGLSTPRPDDDASAEWWFERGLDLEEEDTMSARAAYREATAQDPGHAAAHANLGRLLHEKGDLGAAEGHYRQALMAEAGNPTAAFNLGVVLEDLGRSEEALEAYLKALASDPELASAHFNAARLLESRGDKAEALGHLVEYRRIETRG
ncbi:MAG: tetratricopeptide repeat protein [Longimicrobiales bacterium]